MPRSRTNTPAIRVRGLRGKSFPTGYIVGRQGNGKGDLQLLDIVALAKMGVASARAVRQATSSAGFGFFAEGLLADSELLGTAVFPMNLTFTDGAAGTIVTAQVGPAATAVFTLHSEDSGGVPNQVGTITFEAAETTGLVEWDGGSLLLVAGKPISVKCPTPADTTLAGVRGTVAGAK